MADGSATFEISVSEGSIRISGSETFVSLHLKELSSVLDQLFAAYGQTRRAPLASTANTPPPADDEARPGSGIEAYPNVFAREGDQLKVTKVIPGSSTAEKAKLLTHIYLYGKHLLSQEPTKGDELRDVLRDHGCLDTGNYAKQMRADKENVIVTQTGPKTLFYKLSVPARERTKSFLASLNS